jgi:serine/threonine protein kinase
MMLKGEHKRNASDFELAKDDLVSKMREWNSIVLHGLPMLPCYASAGCYFQYFVILPSKELQEVSPKFDLSRPADRIALFVTSVNMFRILCSFRLQNQGVIHSAPRMLVQMSRSGDGYVLVGEHVVTKKCRPASDQSIYTLLAEISSHAIQISNRIPLDLDAEGFAHLKITPVCAIHQPANLVELKKAICSVLNALVVLHQNGYIHRDVRWPNVLCNQHGRWLLSDFELSSRIGAPLPARYLNNSNFAPEVRSGESCSPALDIWQVGRLIQTWFVGHRETDQQLLDFSHQLANEVVAMRPDAATALADACFTV